MRLVAIALYFALLFDCNPGAGIHKANLKWIPVVSYVNGQPVNSNLRYRVYKSTNGLVFNPAISNLVTAAWSDNNVIPSATYWYKVTAYDSSTNKESDYSTVLKCDRTGCR